MDAGANAGAVAACLFPNNLLVNHEVKHVE